MGSLEGRSLLDHGGEDAIEDSQTGRELYEVRKVLSTTGHQIMYVAVVTSTDFFKSLPPDLLRLLDSPPSSPTAA